jgi:hypothetical protein
MLEDEEEAPSLHLAGFGLHHATPLKALATQLVLADTTGMAQF